MTDEKTIDLLRQIFGSTEEAIRAYDFKSEIAMLCFVLSVEVIHSFMDLGNLAKTQPVFAIALFIIFIVAVVAYMWVLLPSHNPRAKHASYSPRNVYYVAEPSNIDVDDFVRAVAETDHQKEAAYEILKLNAIRNAKRRRFMLALFVTFLFYLLVVLARVTF